jgi:4-amino-4-deoxychorismate lyase
MKINLDDGYSFGRGVFETIKVVDNKALFLTRHLIRLNKSLEFFGIDKKISEDQVLDFIMNQKNSNYALKLSVSEKNTIFTIRTDPYRLVDKNRMLKLCISDVKRNSTSHTVYHKSFNYYDNIIEKKKAKEKGFDEVIFLNENNFVTEGAVSNIFFVRNDRLYTPPIDAGILNGTMRSYIISKNDVREVYLKKFDIKDYEACFITNALMGVLPVGQIDDFKYEKNALVESLIKDLEELGF